ncbi:MAG: hypothetical protein JXM72_02560, partial [Deltaproteobacteria bacterium]|nr:hypothetical protein [Deltaproteobacteria bacterium]
ITRLPRPIEEDPRAEKVSHLLSEDTRLLWPGGKVAVASVPLTEPLSAALKNVQLSGQLVRGLELAENRLAREQRGLNISERKTGQQRGDRISRLLLLSDEGAERFYRNVESLLRRHDPRVLAVLLKCDSATLGELLFGPGSLARLLLLEHKEAVSHVLLSMVE